MQYLEARTLFMEGFAICNAIKEEPLILCRSQEKLPVLHHIQGGTAYLAPLSGKSYWFVPALREGYLLPSDLNVKFQNRKDF